TISDIEKHIPQIAVWKKAKEKEALEKDKPTKVDTTPSTTKTEVTQ
ncbi:MAG: hypothetical protein QG566_177, partial [Patescibacteria group bacterium]|nr:hypothetical protein [Patescibacteria group bacterium]